MTDITEAEVEAAVAAFIASSRTRDPDVARWPDDYDAEEAEGLRDDIRAALLAAAKVRPVPSTPVADALRDDRHEAECERLVAACNREAARAERAEAELDAVSAAIGSNLWLDPPDGGDVSLAEQISRMRVALEKAEAERDAGRALADRLADALRSLRQLAEFVSATGMGDNKMVYHTTTRVGHFRALLTALAAHAAARAEGAAPAEFPDPHDDAPALDPGNPFAPLETNRPDMNGSARSGQEGALYRHKKRGTTEWQPIETAPKDGRFVLVVDQDSDIPWAARPEGPGSDWWEPFHGWRGWARTHLLRGWMPLPPPPEPILPSPAATRVRCCGAGYFDEPHDCEKSCPAPADEALRERAQEAASRLGGGTVYRDAILAALTAAEARGEERERERCAGIARAAVDEARRSGASADLRLIAAETAKQIAAAIRGGERP